MSTTLLRAKGLSRQLQGEVPVTLVKDIDLDIGQGEFVAITGPSGSGKSSLLYLLGLLDVPSAGSLWLEGEETSRFDENRLADLRLSRLGFVFQANFLLPEFSAVENVLLPIRQLGSLDRNHARQRAEALLADLGLSAQADRMPNQLSGGQSQRVAIARALANDPSIILADEPTGNLDTASGAVVQEILKGLSHKKGRTVIVVTHDPAFAAQADRIIRIVDGRLAA
ncbi:MAG TPA: ABC transporter ATP-binding protein [Rhizomicrobium sp.]|nr:ABC transporter ATP-binding protein [Rhizomicrobium sp.]